MPELEMTALAESALSARSVAAFLGSFDPPHLGHGWILHHLLAHFDHVAVLIPTSHFDKSVHYPTNATLEQRLEMLEALRNAAPERISLGLAHVVLYLRLAERLGEVFPNASVAFGMGDDSYQRLLDSRSYYERLGLAWSDRESRALRVLACSTVVFGRRHSRPTSVQVPNELQRLSSTRVRTRVLQLREQGREERGWPDALEDCVLPAVARLVAKHGLYRALQD